MQYYRMGPVKYWTNKWIKRLFGDPLSGLDCTVNLGTPLTGLLELEVPFLKAINDFSRVHWKERYVENQIVPSAVSSAAPIKIVNEEELRGHAKRGTAWPNNHHLRLQKESRQLGRDNATTRRFTMRPYEIKLALWFASNVHQMIFDFVKTLQTSILENIQFTDTQCWRAKEGVEQSWPVTRRPKN